MEKLSELKEAYAKELGYKDWETCINDQPNYKVETLMDEVALRLCSASARLPFKEELDKMCNHYIQITEEEDKTKWYDNTMAHEVKHWCKWIKVFAEKNGY